MLLFKSCFILNYLSNDTKIKAELQNLFFYIRVFFVRRVAYFKANFQRRKKFFGTSYFTCILRTLKGTPIRPPKLIGRKSQILKRPNVNIPCIWTHYVNDF